MMRAPGVVLICLAGACAPASWEPLRAVPTPATVAPGQFFTLDLLCGDAEQRAAWQPDAASGLLLAEVAAPRGQRRFAGIAATLQDVELPGGETLRVLPRLQATDPGPVESLVALPEFRWLPWQRAIGLLLTSAGLALVAWRWLRRAEPPAVAPQAPPPAPASAREQALTRLRSLDPAAAQGRAEIAAYYVALAAVLRAYLAGAHAIAAPRRTTEETIAAAARAELQRREAMAAVLQACDAVKFANATPDHAARIAAHAQLLHLLEEEAK